MQRIAQFGDDCRGVGAHGLELERAAIDKHVVADTRRAATQKLPVRQVVLKHMRMHDRRGYNGGR